MSLRCVQAWDMPEIRPDERTMIYASNCGVLFWYCVTSLDISFWKSMQTAYKIPLIHSHLYILAADPQPPPLPPPPPPPSPHSFTPFSLRHNAPPLRSRRTMRSSIRSARHTQSRAPYRDKFIVVPSNRIEIIVRQDI